MMAVLPNRFDNNEGRLRRQCAEHFHPVLLAIDKPVSLDGIALVSPANVAALSADGIHDGFFGLSLRRPALLVGR